MLRLLSVLSLLLVPALAQAELKMSPVFGDSMVVQRDKPIHVWGWTTPGTEVNVSMAGHSASGKADQQGRFDVSLDPLSAGGGPQELTIKADETKTFRDVLVGEVWLCSGQSNMAWPVASANDPDLETLGAKFPNIRLISVPQVASQEPLNDFNGKWEVCTPETVRNFSAVGYFFGRQLHQTLDVPIGLIDNAWGGSAAEAWVRRDVLEEAGQYDELIKQWDQNVANYDQEAVTANFQKRMKKWQEDRKGNRPRPPRSPISSNHRPANLYNGVLHPVLGYTIRGAVWYQGESNASRAYQYRDLFPLMIQNWRDEWGQGDFSFYWVQLADFRNEVSEPAGSDWAELREAQTMTMSRLANTGEAVITDLGEAADIHPRNKQDVAKRLARWALAKDYGYEIVFHSPMYQSMEAKGNKVAIKFDHVGGGMDTFDVREPIGFAIAGADKKFVTANAKLAGKDTIEVWSDSVTEPVAVRYAWADNPIANVQNKEGLPLTPFRTDDWPGVTVDKVK
ncbi:MAG: sialate O-acetylesterase [Rubripirellula sp.]|nr:sialate O-acetylesterase [Rubripirellula sp.]